MEDLSTTGTLEEILKRLEVGDLIRCKSVCKSWSSLISNPLFIQSHLKHSYQRDRNNDAIGHRRIAISALPDFLMYRHYTISGQFFEFNDCYLLGSCNGLVCISPRVNEVILINPLTREIEKVPNPGIPETKALSWGFGYDSVKDDYKIVLGFRKGDNCTSFQMFSLRTRVWKDVGEVDYAWISTSAILCKGMLHWVVYEEHVILSFHLTEEEFWEISQPDDPCQLYFGELRDSMCLGIMEDCLCMFNPSSLPDRIWVMKDYDYDKTLCWEMVGDVCETKRDAVHRLKLLASYGPDKGPLCLETVYFPGRVFLRAPLFVESIVSPHLQETEENEASNEESSGQATK